MLDQRRLFEGRLVRVTFGLVLRSLHELWKRRAYLVDFGKLLHELLLLVVLTRVCS